MQQTICLGNTFVRRASFILVFALLVAVLAQPASGDRAGGGGGSIDPFATWAHWIQASKGETIEGSVTAQRQPIDVYIYQDKGYTNVSQYQREEAIYSHRGITSRFEFVSDIDTYWLLVIVNSNNLTEEVEFEYTIHETLAKTLIGLAPTIVQVAGPLAVAIIAAVVYHKEKDHRSF